MKLIFDAGALLALERNDPIMWRSLKQAEEDELEIVSHGGIIGQAWRSGGPRQARLSVALESIDIRPLDAEAGRAAGELLALTRTRDVIDAALVLLAEDGDQIFTSDIGDLEPLALAADLHVELIPV